MKLAIAFILGLVFGYALRKPEPVVEPPWRDWAPGADFV